MPPSETFDQHALAFEEEAADAVAMRVKLLLQKGHLAAAVRAVELAVNDQQQALVERRRRIRDPLSMPVCELLPDDLRAINMLENQGVYTVGVLVTWSRAQIKAVGNVNERTVARIEMALARHHLTLAEPWEEPNGDC